MKEFTPAPDSASIVSVTDRVKPVTLGMAVTSVHFLKERAAFVGGEENVAFVDANCEITTVAVHSGGILSTATDGKRLVMGGDDGKVVSLDAKGEVTLLATDPKRRWIDAVALHDLVAARRVGDDHPRGLLDEAREELLAPAPLAVDAHLRKPGLTQVLDVVDREDVRAVDLAGVRAREPDEVDIGARQRPLEAVGPCDDPRQLDDVVLQHTQSPHDTAAQDRAHRLGDVDATELVAARVELRQAAHQRVLEGPHAADLRLDALLDERDLHGRRSTNRPSE